MGLGLAGNETRFLNERAAGFPKREVALFSKSDRKVLKGISFARLPSLHSPTNLAFNARSPTKFSSCRLSLSPMAILPPR